MNELKHNNNNEMLSMKLFDARMWIKNSSATSN